MRPTAPLAPPPLLLALPASEAARMRRTVPVPLPELASLPSSLLPVVESKSPSMRPESSEDAWKSLNTESVPVPPSCTGGLRFASGSATAASKKLGKASSLSLCSRTIGRSWPSSKALRLLCTAFGRTMFRASQRRKSIQRWRCEVARAICNERNFIGEAEPASFSAVKSSASGGWNQAMARLMSLSLETWRRPRRPCRGNTA
mmetsp:Transcript_68462/g.151615  ORF Transcript_68462/g.151615 Transcript_68462/m.151615 type:complete len:203 (+) Transcript_68462:922-1530(+)